MEQLFKFAFEGNAFQLPVFYFEQAIFLIGLITESQPVLGCRFFLEVVAKQTNDFLRCKRRHLHKTYELAKVKLDLKLLVS